jgi:response regulator NasT
MDLRILVIDSKSLRASIVEEGLREAGFHDVMVLRETPNLLRRIVEIDPDVLFVDLESPSRDVLEQMFQVSRSIARPIAMFVDYADTATIEAAVDAGVSAYVVDGLRKERIKPILDLTISRFNAFRRLRDELDQTKQQLEDRKVIDRAKGVVMKLRRVSEEDAYRLLRETAMSQNQRVAEVARSVLAAAKLLV